MDLNPNHSWHSDLSVSFIIFYSRAIILVTWSCMRLLCRSCYYGRSKYATIIITCSASRSYVLTVVQPSAIAAASPAHHLLQKIISLAEICGRQKETN